MDRRRVVNDALMHLISEDGKLVEYSKLARSAHALHCGNEALSMSWVRHSHDVVLINPFPADFQFLNLVRGWLFLCLLLSLCFASSQPSPMQTHATLIFPAGKCSEYLNCFDCHDSGLGCGWCAGAHCETTAGGCYNKTWFELGYNKATNSSLRHGDPGGPICSDEELN